MGESPILSPNRRIRCPSCGGERLAVRSERDPIDRLYQKPSDMVRRLFVADLQLYHCYACRLQFYDVGESAEPPGKESAEVAREEMVSAEPSAADSTLIGPTVTIKGMLSSQEDVLVIGEIQGDIEIPDRRLTIGMGGRLYGDVRADEVVALGTVEGEVEARRRFTLRASATMTGGIRAPSITIEEGAFFKGRIETA